jgi:acid phosphatase (class A)
VRAFPLTGFRKIPLLLAAALALGACAHGGPVSVLEQRSGEQARSASYVAPELFASVLFPPPPVPDSAEQQADLAGVLAWQNKRTEADCARAARTANDEYDAFWGDRSPFPGPVPGEFKEFFARVAADFEEALDRIKDRFKRPRPFAAYPDDARPCIKKSKSFSYPSGHSSAARATAGILSDLVPQRRDEFYSKADAIALDRLVGGVHYPADIAAGKAFGDLFHEELLKSADYRREMEKMKALLAK